MSPQRRTALVSVGAACLLVAIKLVAGLASSSLGLLAEAAHSGTDLAAALLTFFAVSVAVRPADRGHPWGHAKAQNLAALAEAGFLILVSVGIAAAAILRLTGVVEFEVEPTWWVFAAIALVLVIDASRTAVSLRGARLTEAMRCSPTPFTSGATSPVRSRCSQGSSRRRSGSRPATRSRRSSSRVSSSPLRLGSRAGTSTCSWIARPTRRPESRGRRSRGSNLLWSSGGCGCGAQAASTSRTS